jgi:hypothetical protein
MTTLFHVTVRSDQDEVFEFEATQPIVHLDIPTGRYLITVRCSAGSDQARLIECTREPPGSQGSNPAQPPKPSTA